MRVIRAYEPFDADPERISACLKIAGTLCQIL
ncbi:hypothetical protein MPNT_460007 [Candidatus Methylacidithermus pantelleriae]|uniref:Uncharacterized protein n=1 Tax=Candidatus Methylacidithermus pantelleriae TaxID=2744239 RepID=A0A8J2BPS5_9BACT|nr:hypothetical protein MPNT_460007 [Candidatus Methylacidithermus pantelleriae]